MSNQTMNVAGKVSEVCEEGLATFKVRTRLGTAYVWVYEEIEINFRVGADFEVIDAPITFADGYVLAVIKPGVMFHLDDIIYETSAVIGT